MKKILIIEDNQWLQENTKELLEFENFEIITANNGQEGLELARHEKPDLILCDILMPGMNGYDVLAAMQEDKLLYSIPFIFFTASSEKSEINKAIEMGANGYIIKPFDPENLVQIIQSQLPGI